MDPHWFGSLNLDPHRGEKFKREHPALQNMKFFTFLFLWAFFALWIRIWILPAKINEDPDPQHWFYDK
jgi:hypothetical protein